MSHFFFSPSNIKSAAVACAPADVPASYIIMNQVFNHNALEFKLVLRNISFGKNGSTESSNLSLVKHIWLDYQPNSLAWPIVSNRLKNIISENVSGEEDIKWISVFIESDPLNVKEYYLLVFNSQRDVLDIGESIFSGSSSDFLVNPAFSKDKVKDLNIFCTPDKFPQITGSIYVNEKIKNACKKIFGLNFEEINLY